LIQWTHPLYHALPPPPPRGQPASAPTLFPLSEIDLDSLVADTDAIGVHNPQRDEMLQLSGITHENPERAHIVGRRGPVSDITTSAFDQFFSAVIPVGKTVYCCFNASVDVSCAG